jgi:hypothetical protein
MLLGLGEASLHSCVQQGIGNAMTRRCDVMKERTVSVSTVEFGSEDDDQPSYIPRG